MERWQSCLEIGRNLVDRHQIKIRFLLAGIFNTAVALVIYPVLYFLSAPLNLHYLTILLLGYIVTLTCGFLTNKLLVFRTTGNYLQESGKFLILHLSYLLINLATLPALVEIAGIDPVWAQTLFVVLVVVTSYIWHSRITFSSTNVVK